MTDDDRLPDPSMLIPSLPPGSAVVVRSKSQTHLESLVGRVSDICRRCQVALLISYVQPPQVLISDGIHVPEKSRKNWSRRDLWRLRPGIVTTSAHSLNAANRAGNWGADAVLLSPIAATQSHPDSNSLGFWRGAAIRRQIDVPAIALGGIHLGSLRRTFDLGFSGCAGIGLFAPRDQAK